MTDSVFNQTPPMAEYNLYTTDRALQEAVRRDGAPPAEAAARLLAAEKLHAEASAGAVAAVAG